MCSLPTLLVKSPHNIDQQNPTGLESSSDIMKIQNIQELMIHLWKCYKKVMEMVGTICVLFCEDKDRRQTKVVTLPQSENRKLDEGQIPALLYTMSLSYFLF